MSFLSTIVVCIWVHRVNDVVCQCHDKRINFEPVVQTIVLLFVESSDFLILDLFELYNIQRQLRPPKVDFTEEHVPNLFITLAEFFETLPIDALKQLLFQVLPPAIVECRSGGVSETKDVWSGFGSFSNSSALQVTIGFLVSIDTAVRAAGLTLRWGWIERSISSANHVYVCGRLRIQVRERKRSNAQVGRMMRYAKSIAMYPRNRSWSVRQGSDNNKWYCNAYIDISHVYG